MSSEEANTVYDSRICIRCKTVFCSPLDLINGHRVCSYCRDRNNLVVEQQPPVEGVGEDVWLLVMQDMEERRQGGIAKYGQPVRHDNGRDHLVDAYQEILDAAVYLRAEIERRRRAQSEDTH